MDKKELLKGIIKEELDNYEKAVGYHKVNNEETQRALDEATYGSHRQIVLLNQVVYINETTIRVEKELMELLGSLEQIEQVDQLVENLKTVNDNISEQIKGLTDKLKGLRLFSHDYLETERSILASRTTLGEYNRFEATLDRIKEIYFEELDKKPIKEEKEKTTTKSKTKEETE